MKDLKRPQEIEDSCVEEDPCGECHNCSYYCDVCGKWFWKDEPCELH